MWHAGGGVSSLGKGEQQNTGKKGSDISQQSESS